MKKLLTLLLTLLMIFTISGCNSSSQDGPIVDDPIIEEDTPLVGGFTEVEDGTLTDELKDIFNKALDGLMGATYEPVELVATQVVAGTNYKFLANGTKTTNPITKGTYYITVYEDLQGDVKLLDIETIEEKQEETASTDPSEYSYWVVFKNPDGNELQRTIEKYGTTPEYVGDTPVYWDSDYWYRFTNWDKELKPITTNTYITAEYEMGGPLKKETVDIEKLPLYQYVHGDVDWSVTIFEYDQVSGAFIKTTNGAIVNNPGVNQGWYHKQGNQLILCAENSNSSPHGLERSLPTPP